MVSCFYYFLKHTSTWTAFNVIVHKLSYKQKIKSRGFVTYIQAFTSATRFTNDGDFFCITEPHIYSNLTLH